MFIFTPEEDVLSFARELPRRRMAHKHTLLAIFIKTLLTCGQQHSFSDERNRSGANKPLKLINCSADTQSLSQSNAESAERRQQQKSEIPNDWLFLLNMMLGGGLFRYRTASVQSIYFGANNTD